MSFPFSPFLQALIRTASSPCVFAPAAVLLYLAASFLTLAQVVENPRTRANFLSGDAKPYLKIAGEIAAGDLSMSYVKGRPHRQPLYPAALAGIIRWKGAGDFFWLAAPNIVFATLGFLGAYAALLYFHGRLIAAVVGGLYLINPFLFGQTTSRFMTEPMHIMLMCGVIFAFLAYLKEDRAWQLFVAVGFTGLDYLVRPNGLFVMFSLCGALAIREAIFCFKTPRLFSTGELPRKAGLYAAAGLLFVAVTAPSWAPRLHEFGNPIYHGYLTNYLWVDTYELGHSVRKFGWKDYVETHSIGDAVQRGLSGVWNVGFSIPLRLEQGFPALYLLAMAGFLIAAARGPAIYRLVAIFAILQLLPLIWTNMSNPNDRVPYGATMPFEIVFAAFCLERAGLRSLERKILSKPDAGSSVNIRAAIKDGTNYEGA